jgi:hypothetical protein
MVKREPGAQALREAFCNSSCERMGSKFEPLGADSSTLDGLNPHGNIVDELHAHKDRGVWDVLDTAMGARRQPLTLAITTAGTYDPESIGWQMHDYATKVLEGVIEDDSFFAFIAAADEPATTGTSARRPSRRRTRTGHQREARLPREAGSEGAAPARASTTSTCGSTSTCGRAGTSVALARALGRVRAGAGARRDARAPRSSARSRAREGPCFGGLDLSTKLDLSALVLAFPGTRQSSTWSAASGSPRRRSRRTRARAAALRDLGARGLAHQTPGDVIDYEFIRAEVLALAKRFGIQEIAFDPWGATQLATQLIGDGLKMVEAARATRRCRSRRRTSRRGSSQEGAAREQPGAALLRLERGRHARPGRQHQAGQGEGGRPIDGVVARSWRSAGASPPQSWASTPT